MTKQILLLITTVFLLSACTTNRLSKNNVGEVMTGQKALVILGCSSIVKIRSAPWGPNLWGEFRCGTSWQRGATNQLLRQTEHQYLYVVDPGIYNLRSFGTIAQEYIYSANNLKGIATFSVEGGEVLYLGDLKFDIVKSALVAKMISVEDYFERASDILNEVNPFLAGQLRKELITLSDMVNDAQENGPMITATFRSPM